MTGSAIPGKDCPAYRCAHAGYGSCAGATSTGDWIFRAAALRVIDVDRRSPDERSDIRERLPRISLRSCGLRLPVPGRRRRAIGFSGLLHTTSLMLIGVARMSSAISGKDCPAYRFIHAGYGCFAGATSMGDRIFRAAAHRVIDVERCSPDERSDIRERKTTPHIAALMRATVAAPGRRRRAIEFSGSLHTTSLMLISVARMSQRVARTRAR
jgi:hypothetical protein